MYLLDIIFKVAYVSYKSGVGAILSTYVDIFTSTPKTTWPMPIIFFFFFILWKADKILFRHTVYKLLYFE